MVFYDTGSKYRLYNFMRYRYDWPPELVATYDSLLASSHQPTALIACMFTPKLLKSGRLKTMYVSLVISMISVGIQMIDNMWIILLGKTLIGFALGIVITGAGRLIQEYVPV